MKSKITALSLALVALLLAGCSTAAKPVPVIASPAFGPIWAADAYAVTLNAGLAVNVNPAAK